MYCIIIFFIVTPNCCGLSIMISTLIKTFDLNQPYINSTYCIMLRFCQISSRYRNALRGEVHPQFLICPCLLQGTFQIEELFLINTVLIVLRKYNIIKLKKNYWDKTIETNICLHVSWYYGSIYLSKTSLTILNDIGESGAMAYTEAMRYTQYKLVKCWIQTNPVGALV